ncbi:MAG: Sir2 silent information regulator family NAD-dependent deacetylase [Clostridia bacterium]|nr:Sir2 silent information regulator family NAD-dependent deacetylase [Clostridia bacterium]
MNKTLNDIKELINNADCILIGAGSGLSTAAGIDYRGEEFKKEFAPFIKKYGFTDLYSSSFYNYPTQEEYWGAWAKHIYFANTGRNGTELYKKIFDLVKNKEYFVITTNVDDQFYKTGFDKDKIFRVQGSYALNQCSKGCHNRLYSNVELVNNMLDSIDDDLKVPTELVPICPVCGESMEPNLRKDGYFIQDDVWYKQNDKYEKFLDENKNKNVLLLEFGVGFNTPGIIRFPFEQMTSQNENWKLIRFNKEDMTFLELDDRFIGIKEDINKFFRV